MCSLFFLNTCLFAQDQLIFNNGDVLSGKYLGRTDTIIFFESPFLGVVKIATANASLKLEDSVSGKQIKSPESVVKERALSKEENAPLFAKSKEKSNDLVTSGDSLESAGTLSLLWDSTEKTLNRFVHDRVPTWFPSLPPDWKGDLSLGLNLTENVNSSKRYHGSFSLEGDKSRMNYKFKSQFGYAKQNKKRSENDWGLSARLRYKLRNTDFFESLVTHDIDYLHDPIIRSAASIGFGVKPLNKKNLKFDYVLGGAWEVQDRREKETLERFKVNFNENFKYQFSKHLTFTQNLRFYTDPSDDWSFNYRFESGLKTLIVGSFNLGLSYRLDYDSRMKDSGKRKKTKIITTLGVKF